MRLLVIKPRPSYGTNSRFEEILEYALSGTEHQVVTSVSELERMDVKGRRILFAVSLGISGINSGLYAVLEYLRMRSDALEGCVGGVILDGKSDLYTKSVGRSVVFTANLAGCSFPGRCLVEGTGTLKNYNLQAKNNNTDNMSAYRSAARTLVENILGFEHTRKKNPKILVLHASDEATSNTLALWNMIKEKLPECSFKEISLRNGHIMDCRGCAYEVCRHYSEKGTCFYGGPIAETVYPAVLECDALVMICPNYNDALSGNLTAFVNRLTSLYVNHRFYDKSLFGIIVSGYSGCDIVAEQLISGINMNKTFALPGRFAIMETAGSPKEILSSPGLEQRAERFVLNMRQYLIES